MTREEVIELCSREAHDQWMQSKRAAGFTSRPAEDGTEQMVPYEQLPEHLKDLDRATVRGVVETLVKYDLLVM